MIIEDRDGIPLLSDKELLNHYGWEINCQNPYEVSHSDGSFASGQAVPHLIYSLKEDWRQEQLDLQEQDE